MLTAQLYRNNIKAIMDDECSINLGAVYESFVAQELTAHGNGCYYYDNKKNGEVDYLIDDPAHLSTMPIEVKSGKDYTVHSALNKFLEIKDYNINKAYVVSNEYRIFTDGAVTYMPIYNVMFLQPEDGVIGEW